MRITQADIARTRVSPSMRECRSHHLWPDPAAVRNGELVTEPEAGVTTAQELMILASLVCAAALCSLVVGLEQFLLLSAGATFGALVVGRMASAGRDGANAPQR